MNVKQLSTVKLNFRFSKKEAAKILAEQEEKNSEIGGELTPPKQFERKNSFLGKIFGGSSKKKGPNSSAKPVLGTFSAQFPPPELLTESSDPHATYQALKKAAQSIYNSPPPPPPLIPANEIQKLSLEENYYDRPQNANANNNGNNFPIYSQVTRKQPKDKQNNNIPTMSEQQQQQQHVHDIYSVTSPMPVYGYSMPGNVEGVYSFPPPPLPYRPINWNNNGPNSLQVFLCDSYWVNVEHHQLKLKNYCTDQRGFQDSVSLIFVVWWSSSLNHCT